MSMSSFSKGDQVVAARPLHRMSTPAVAAGTPGVVVAAGLFTPTKVEFRVSRMFDVDQAVTIQVEPFEITRA